MSEWLFHRVWEAACDPVCENWRNQALIRHVKQEAGPRQGACVWEEVDKLTPKEPGWRSLFKGVVRPKLKPGNEKVDDGPPAQGDCAGMSYCTQLNQEQCVIPKSRTSWREGGLVLVEGRLVQIRCFSGKGCRRCGHMWNICFPRSWWWTVVRSEFWK